MYICAPPGLAPKSVTWVRLAAEAGAAGATTPTATVRAVNATAAPTAASALEIRLIVPPVRGCLDAVARQGSNTSASVVAKDAARRAVLGAAGPHRLRHRAGDERGHPRPRAARPGTAPTGPARRPRTTGGPHPGRIHDTAPLRPGTRRDRAGHARHAGRGRPQDTRRPARRVRQDPAPRTGSRTHHGLAVGDGSRLSTAGHPTVT